MIQRIKNKIERRLFGYARNIDKEFALNKISPLLSKSIRNFLTRQGKRIRPTLFIVSYLGYTKKPARNLYACAISLELLHNFMLIHDDIIDNADLRKGLPSMHRMLDGYLKGYKKAKFKGTDLAIVIGDIVYAMAINTFLSIQENFKRKEMALKKFTEAALYTGSGEFVELLCGLKDIRKITKNDIYKIYDLKTAHYTFCSPLVIGAILAGAKSQEINKLTRYGLYLGRAFQVRDDILDMFSKESEIGKPALTDLREAKKTLLLWYAFKKTTLRNKSYIARTLSKNNVTRFDLIKIRGIVRESGALDYAKQEISFLLKQAQKISASLTMRYEYKRTLDIFSEEYLKI